PPVESPNRSGRASDDEPDIEPWMLGPTRVGGRGAEDTARLLALAPHGLMDGRQWGIGVRRLVDVVEAADRQVLGDRDAVLPGRMQRAEGRNVAHRQHCCGPLP